MMQQNLTITGWEDAEYKAFVDKFKSKKTTDDCYTPPIIYDAIAEWVAAEYGTDKSNFVRPFYPGGDYERFCYPKGCAVVDNPPFSILSKIISFYSANGVRFFLFAPALTLFNYTSVTCIPVGVSITYDNGAKVSTSFVTNMGDPGIRVRTAPTLYQAVKAANDKNQNEYKKSLPRYEYPDNIITAAMVQRWCKYGIDYKLTVDDSRVIAALDAQKNKGVTIFGGGFILSTRAAAERAAAERAAAERAAAERWEMSDREKEIVRIIDKKMEQKDEEIHAK